MKHVISILFLLLTSHALFAQGTCGVRVKACVTQEGVTLRWAPMDMQTFQKGIDNGYVVERYAIVRDDEVLSVEEISKEKTTTEAIKVTPIEEWEKYVEDKYVAIAAECIYGKQKEIVGVSPIEAYSRHREKQQRYSFALYAADMSPKAAMLSGLMMKDTRIDKKTKYLYKVYLAQSDTLEQDTAMVFVNAGIETSMMNIEAPKVSWSNKRAEVSLDLTYLDGYYTTYIVERSVDEGKSWNSITDVPTISVSSENQEDYLYVTDTLPDNETIVHYRVYGIDCFGRRSPVSETTKGKGKMPLTSVPQIVRCEAKDNNRVEIEWNFPDSLNASVTGFRLYRQSGPKSRLKKIMEGIDSNQRVYVDNLPGNTNYYKVSAYNNETELLMAGVKYVALVDSIAPIPPIGLVGKIDTIGISEIRWTRNKEKDLAGYRIYTANRPNAEYTLLTPMIIRDTTYRHKVNLRTLTHEIYYQVRAVDKRDNHSQPSEKLKLMRPDTIAPVAPRLQEVGEKNGYPLLTWIRSSSGDVKNYVILRRKENTESFDSISVVNAGVMEYVDNKTEIGLDYIYGIYAVDTSGNRSKTSQNYYTSSNKQAVKVNMKIRNESVGNRLIWRVETQKEVERYIIYRATGEESLRPYATTEGTSYLDEETDIENKYRYALQIIYKDGSRSEIH